MSLQIHIWKDWGRENVRAVPVHICGLYWYERLPLFWCREFAPEIYPKHIRDISRMPSLMNFSLVLWVYQSNSHWRPHYLLHNLQCYVQIHCFLMADPVFSIKCQRNRIQGQNTIMYSCMEKSYLLCTMRSYVVCKSWLSFSLLTRNMKADAVHSANTKLFKLSVWKRKESRANPHVSRWPLAGTSRLHQTSLWKIRCGQPQNLTHLGIVQQKTSPTRRYIWTYESEKIAHISCTRMT